MSNHEGWSLRGGQSGRPETISLCFVLFLFLSLQSSVVVRSDANRVAGSNSRFKEGLIETERVMASATVRDDGGGEAFS